MLYRIYTAYQTDKFESDYRHTKKNAVLIFATTAGGISCWLDKATCFWELKQVALPPKEAAKVERRNRAPKCAWAEWQIEQLGGHDCVDGRFNIAVYGETCKHAQEASRRSIPPLHLIGSSFMRHAHAQLSHLAYTFTLRDLLLSSAGFTKCVHLTLSNPAFTFYGHSSDWMW